MTKLSKLRNAFLAELGTRLAALGMPVAVEKKTYQFIQATEAGHIGIGVNPRYRGEEGIDFQLRCSIRVSAVEAQFAATGINDITPSFGGADTSERWTASGLLKEMARYQGGLDDIDVTRTDEGRLQVDVNGFALRVARYGTDDGYVEATADVGRVAEVADQVYQRFKRYGWPVLDRYGKTEAAFLELTLRNDRLAEYMFLDPRKPLAGLILATRLGNPKARKRLIADALVRYKSAAKYGNPELLEQFKRIAIQEGLASPSDFSILSSLAWWR